MSVFIGHLGGTQRAKDGASNLLPTNSNVARGQHIIKFAAVKSDSQTEISHVSRKPPSVRAGPQVRP